MNVPDITITRRFEIDAGHRLLKHGGKCRNYHGHRYVFEVTLGGKLQWDGMIIDFGEIKTIIGGWLDEYWDHGMILQAGDPLIDFLRQENCKVFVLAFPPTAENLCAGLTGTIRELLVKNGFGSLLYVVSVVCEETPNCKAEFKC